MKLHPNFGAPQYGLPFATVGAGQTRVPMSFLYASFSEPGPYPFPLDAPIQPDTDRHAIVFDKDACLVYETYDTHLDGSGFYAGSGAIFNLATGAPRPEGWTSATASGLSLFAGMARAEEVLDDGEILHAMIFTFGWTTHAYTSPATHSSGTSSDPYAPPMGLRVRLRADYDLSRFHGESLIILKALKRFGMLVVDNSQPDQFWALGGAQSTRWNDSDLGQLKGVPGSAFEVLKLGTIKY